MNDISAIVYGKREEINKLSLFRGFQEQNGHTYSFFFKK